MPSKTTVNCLFNDIWCYLVIDSFDWKISVFQQTAVGIYYILKTNLEQILTSFKEYLLTIAVDVNFKLLTTFLISFMFRE